MDKSLIFSKKRKDRLEVWLLCERATLALQDGVGTASRSLRFFESFEIENDLSEIAMGPFSTTVTQKYHVSGNGCIDSAESYMRFNLT